MCGWGSWEDLGGVEGLLIRTHYMKTVFSIIIIIICDVYAFVMTDLGLGNRDRLTDILLQISLFIVASILLLIMESLLTFLTVNYKDFLIYMKFNRLASSPSSLEILFKIFRIIGTN